MLLLLYYFMYEGESIIIRNAVAFVFLLAAPSFSHASLGMVSFYHCCASLKLTGQFLCRNRNINHGHCAFRLHQGRATFRDPFFVVWRCIRRRNPLKTFSTMWEQCFAATECLRTDRKIKKWSHKCYAWRSRTPIHGQNWRQYWLRRWHGSVRQTTDYWWSGTLSVN